jgi:hypothetical protein
MEDHNNVCKVFLIVPTAVDGHAEVGRVRKLDLEKLSFFLGHDDFNHRYIRNGRPVRQLCWGRCRHSSANYKAWRASGGKYKA